MPQSWALCDKKQWLKKFYICVFHDTWKIQWMGHLLSNTLPFAQKKFPLDKVPSKCTKNLLLMLYGNLLEEAHVNATIRE
jgi:hypothetical protein